VDEIRAESWAQLQDLLFADSWHEALKRHRSDFVFRGEASGDTSLVTSLQRLGGDYGEIERHLLRNFRKYAHRDVVHVDELWYWMALAKHHGLATRMLDWTYSPYVALHFATARLRAFDQEGAVWMVDYLRAHELVPRKLRQQLEQEAANVFTTEMLTTVASDFEDLEKLGDDFVVFVEPPSFDDRIVNQYALFSLSSQPDVSLDRWLESHPDLTRKLVIPAELKWEIRDKLDQANLTERVLFPGLDGLSRWLARYYAPRR
jgi:hypothetical protein